MSCRDLSYSFSTPLPTDIVSVRRIKLKPNANLFDGADATAINRSLQTYSLVHVLVYRFVEQMSLWKIPPISWKEVYKRDSNLKGDDTALVGNDSQVVTLHFFAEPDRRFLNTSVHLTESSACLSMSI